jgi:hypothetical protein
MLLNSLGYYFSCGRTHRVRSCVYWFVRNVFASPCVVAFIETKNTGNVVLNFLQHLVCNSFLLCVSGINILCLTLYFIFMNSSLFFFCAQCMNHMFWSLMDTCELDFCWRVRNARRSYYQKMCPDTTDNVATSGGSTLNWIPCSELTPMCWTPFGGLRIAQLLIVGPVESSPHSQALFHNYVMQSHQR